MSVVKSLIINKNNIPFINKASSQTTTMLGRWKLKNECNKTEMLSVFWANSDHCGDIICGDPKYNKEYVKTELEKLESESKENTKKN